MNKPQASHTAAWLQERVGEGSPGYLTDATQVSLLLGILLQETKRKTVLPALNLGRNAS